MSIFQSDLALDLNAVDTVFVYGTLKRGHYNNNILSSSEFISEAVTDDSYYLFDCGFPYLCTESKLYDPLPVLGELYRVDDPYTLARLDRLEGHPQHYYRSLIRVNGHLAWSYLMTEDLSNQLPICSITEEGYYKWRE